MHLPEINEAQRSEILFALQDRRKALEKEVADSNKIHAPNKTAERLLKLYGDDEEVDRVAGKRKWLPGLLAMFASEAQLTDDQKTARDRGFDRTVDGQQDAFGGGAETGAGTPAGQREWLDGRGNSHPTEAEAEASDRAQAELDGGGIGAEPAEPTADSAPAGSPLALVVGDGSTVGTPVPSDESVAEYEIVDDRRQPVYSADDAVHFDEQGRCKGCRAFRGEGHDTNCPVLVAVNAANAANAGKPAEEPWDTPQRRTPAEIAADEQRDRLAAAASGAKPSGAPRAPDMSVSTMAGDGVI